MNDFLGYMRTLGQYLSDPKGRHDTLDFLWAGLIVALVSGALMYLTKDFF